MLADAILALHHKICHIQGGGKSCGADKMCTAQNRTNWLGGYDKSQGALGQSW